ncbi:MAG: SMP-30/gluconolactonase/LRE family protein [Planctomycetota bacterium]
MSKLIQVCFVLWLTTSVAFAIQPKVGLSHGEPTWPDLLKKQWGLDIDRDLRNPLVEGVKPAAMFQRFNKKKPVTFKPLIALGMETTTRGGWYTSEMRGHVAVVKKEAWSYTYKQSEAQMKSGKFTKPPLESGSGQFDPGDRPFGLWVSNDQFNDGGVYTGPRVTAGMNKRLKKQPYKAMIYPYVDPETKKFVEHSYLIGWEYSTNDDFQDVVARIDNVKLMPAHPPLKGILAPEAQVKKLAGGFTFVEGPAWDRNHKVLYFSDIPPLHIIGYADGKASVANPQSGGSNGLMFDKHGMLIACEHKNRRVSRAIPGQEGTTIVSHYQDKKLNSPNDLWIDQTGGFYFTDPRYGKRDNMEQDKEAVYYVTAEGKITRVIDQLVRPNGIAMSPDGKILHVVDNGAHSVHNYPVTAPGRIGKGKRVAYVIHPDGMTVDKQGRLYITSRYGIAVLEPNGKWIGLIAMAESPANCTFGGPKNNILFITARKSLYSIDTLTRGWHVHLDGLVRR